MRKKENERASLHPITRKGPAEDFFEGALLGNGGMGCVVTVRPDAIQIFFGHNNVWDRRVPTAPTEGCYKFKEVFDKIEAISDELPSLLEDPWFKEHFDFNFSRYGEKYPRPFPCGNLVLGFDPRVYDVEGYELDISNGLCQVFLASDETRITVEIFIESERDTAWFRTVSYTGDLLPHPFERIALYTDPTTPMEFPRAEYTFSPELGQLSFQQKLFVAGAVESPGEGQEYTLAVSCNQALEARRVPMNLNKPGSHKSVTEPDFKGMTQRTPPHEKYFSVAEPLVGRVKLLGRAVNLEESSSVLELEESSPTDDTFQTALVASAEAWSAYWACSEVSLGDSFLERIWYHNTYFLNCVLKSGATCPGIFGNWFCGDIGTAWHGDYHLNYNTQQLFWGCFSSNHSEKHLPYLETLERYIVPVAQRWASEYYEMRGICFPYCAVPIDTDKPFLLGADWSWGVGISAWAVQSLWWHYQYTQDSDLLRERVFPLLKSVALFLVDYLSRPECSDERWKDDCIHVFPSLSQELYRMRPGFAFNYDGIVDLAMIRFLFRAYAEAEKILEERDAVLLESIRKIEVRLPDYPKSGDENERVFVSVPGEHPETIHNTPQPLVPVFPADEYGLHSDNGILEIARQTYRMHRNEGGNNLVFYHIQGARLGCLDLEKFKKQIRYCLLPNGTCTDMNQTAGGRFGDQGSFSFMKRMGIWVENFALPAVINECLIQSYNGTIRLFPNWEGDASFRDLRAVGAFLVSAEKYADVVRRVSVTSEKGGLLRLINPFPKTQVCINGEQVFVSDDPVLYYVMSAGDQLKFKLQI